MKQDPDSLPPHQVPAHLFALLPSFAVSAFSLSVQTSSSPMAAFARTLTSSLLLLFLFLNYIEAKEILVGGKTDAWKIPSSESDSLNKWAENSRFRIGDSLAWKYDGSKDSVLQVTKEDYASCNTSNPTAEYKDGNTKVKLEKSGPFYFISGAKGHCEQGQKLVVVVLSSRHRYTGISPAPSPAEIEGPAIAPTSNAAGLKAGFLVTLGVLVLGLFEM
ncbi:Phytocyanin domain - like 10 [Theobroma cacao]|nr:Phytocyanin domain - like 10 [Theobroma cacao]